MTRARTRSLLVAAAGLALVTASPSRALERDVFDDYKLVGTAADSRRKPDPLKVSGLTFDPSIEWKLAGVATPHVFGGVTGGYGDNLLRAPDGGDVRRDFYGRGEAGARADVQIYDHLISAEYRATGTLYSKETDLDALEQSAAGRLELSFPHFSVHGEGSWSRSFYSDSILIRGLVREDNEAGSGFVQGQLGDLSFGAGGGFQRVDFRTSPQLQQFDHTVALASAQLGWALHKEVHVTAQYSYQKVVFDSSLSQDYDVHAVRAGIVGPLTPKLSFSLMGGADFQVVQRSEDPNQTTRQYRGFACESAITWRPYEALGLTLVYRRDLRWSPGSEFQINDFVQLEAVHSFLDEKLEVRASAAYEHIRPARGDSAERFFPSARVTWKIKRWLQASAVYSYDQAWSASPQIRYDAHRAELTIGAAF